MGMTMTQKILAAHAGLPEVRAGQLIRAKLSMVLGNDITSPVAINEFEKAGFPGVFDREKIALVMDHFAPNKDIKAAEQCKQCRTFARRFDVKNYFDVGEMGIEHALLPEKGLVAPGEAWSNVPSPIRFVLTGKLGPCVSGKDVILHIIGRIGVDGALYKSMEFTGPGLASLSMDDRLCIANMAIEAGAKNGIFEVDQITLDYVKGRVDREFTVYQADEDALYDQTMEIDLSAIEPTVAFPHLPENARTFDQIGEIPIDQVVIGSCTNGRISDLAAAAEIFKGRHAAKGVRVIIIPATQAIYKEAMKRGYLETFLDAGCVVSTPTCGPCLGGYMGILAAGERCVATTNRNFVGRMGHVDSEVYLASPAVAAASAVAGKIADPRTILENKEGSR